MALFRMELLPGDALQLAGERARTDTPMTEHGIMAWILDRFERAGVSTDHGPIVAAGTATDTTAVSIDVSVPR